MTNSSGKILVYSAPCSDGTYSVIDGVPMHLEVSKTTIQARPMSLAEVKEAADYFDKSIDVVKALIDIGQASLDFLKDEKIQKLWKDRLSVVAGVGDIIKGILMFIPDPENPMVQQLQDLADRVEELGDKISDNFNEMKSLLTEVNFFVKVLSPTSVLTRYMRDCFKHPGPEAKENFRRNYVKNPPLKLAYALQSYLEQRSTNPLRMAMDAEKAKTRTTFNKWEDIINRILGQYLILEAFANGLFNNKSSFNRDQLLSLAQNVFKDIHKWREEYTKEGNASNKCWEEIKIFVPNFLKSYSHLDNGAFAFQIKEKIETYFTDDSYYIVVFDNHLSNNENRLWSKNRIGNDQLITTDDCGGTRAFVYCSKKANSASKEELEEMRKTVQSYKVGTNAGKMPQLLTSNPIKNAGFQLLIGGLNEEVQFANFTRHDAGPGWYTYHFNFGGAANQLLLAGFE